LLAGLIFGKETSWSLSTSDEVKEETDASFFGYSGGVSLRGRVMTKGEATRQRIIEVAAPIFNRRGYAGCSLQELMDATGMEKGGIYRHFENKEELAAEALKYALTKNMKMRTENLAGIKGSIEKLRQGIANFVELPSAIDGGCPLMNSATDSDDGNPRLRELAAEGLRGWQMRLSKIIIAGMRAGEIRSGVKPRRLANTIIATLEGAQMMSRLQRNKGPMMDAQVALNDLLDGVVCPRRG
jgi:TetR/AcrR family transcriptional repressor of nem operon